MWKKILFLTLSLVIFLFAIFQAKPVETELTKAFFDTSSPIIKLTNISSKYLDVILESDSFEGLEDLKSELPNLNYDSSPLLNVYKNYPENFLSEKTRNLLKQKDYKTLDKFALERVYNPMGFYIALPDFDPYLFATDFVLSQIKDEQTKEFGGKYYSVSHYKITDNSEVERFINAQKNAESGKIYLCGAPVHTFITSHKSAFEINIICLVSTLCLILLCNFYFKSPKIIIPIGLSILFGFMFGYSASALIFPRLHILTFVFSTSLIGISLDYSLHYFLTGAEKSFKKNLTASMLTTVLAFSTLIFSNMEVLREIAVFTSFGLIGVYLFVLIVLSDLKITNYSTFPRFDISRFKLVVLIFVLLIIFCGGLRVKFDDNIKSLYKPSKTLLQSENLYRKVFNPSVTEFILVKGKNLDEIIEQEEKLNIENSISISDFVASKSRQKENLELTKELYNNNLSEYATFLNNEVVSKIKNKEFKLYNVNDFPLKDEFMLDNQTSFVITPKHFDNSINPTEEITKQLSNSRKECLKLLPIVYFVLFVFLTWFFGFKNSIKIVISPILGVLFALSLISICGYEINLFHILALFLIIGFSLDYSIFRLNSGEKSSDAVFMSAFSTAFSFLLLSLTSFKAISSLGITLFLGILSSYLLSLFMIKSDYDK